MADTGLPYSKKQVNRAGKLLRDVRARIVAGDEVQVTEEFVEAVHIADWWRARHARPLARVNAKLRYYVTKVGAAQEVTQRLKRFSTLWDKLHREPTMQLSTMEDIGGVRAILPTQEQVDRLVTDLRSQERWQIRRVREYVEGRDPGPKSDGYRAVHVVVEKDGAYIEIQLRTPWQDAWAQSVEQDTRRLRQGLKFGGGPDDLRKYYGMVSEWFAMRERAIDPDTEFMERLAQLYAATRRYFPEAPGDNGIT
jgi:putative GTP pyrophosphokinase